MAKCLLVLFLFTCSLLTAQKPELVIRREGHVNEAHLVCFSPDGRQALSAGQDNRIILWDLGSRKYVRHIQTDTTPQFLYFAPNGQEAIALLADKTLNAWDLATGQPRWRNPVPAYLSWVHQGDSLLLVQANNILSCWDLGSGSIRWQKPIRKKTPPPLPATNPFTPPPNLAAKLKEMEPKGINKIAFSGDGNTAVVAGGTPTILWAVTPGAPPNREGYGGIMVWDLKKDQLKHPLIELPEMIHAIELNADGSQCLSVSSDRKVRLWDVPTGRELARLERESPMETRFTFSPDFSRLAFTRFDGALKTWNLHLRNKVTTPASLLDSNGFIRSDANSLEFTPEGKSLIAGSRDGSIFRWDGVNLDSIRKFDANQNAEVIHGLAISADGKKLLAGSAKESRIMYLNQGLISKNDIKRYILNAQKDTIGFATATGIIYGTPNYQEGATLTFMPNVDAVSLWDLEKGRLEKVLYPYDAQGWVRDQTLEFSPDGQLALAKIQGKWSAWSIETGNLLGNKEGVQHFQTIYFDKNGGHALTILPNGSLLRWNTGSGEVEKSYTGLGLPLAAGVHASGEKGLSLGKDGMLREWNATSGDIIRQIPIGQMPEEPELHYTPEDHLVLIRGKGSAAIWDLSSGKAVLELGNQITDPFPGDLFWDDHRSEQVSRFEFLPDGKSAISATYDGTLRIWDFRAGTEICTVQFPDETDWAVTTPSGLFDASEGAMQNMYFRLGMEVLELEQLKERYFEPGLLQKLLGFARGGLRPVNEFNHIALYPQIEKAGIAGETLQVQLRERSGGIGRVALLLNNNIELDPNINPEFKTRFELNLRPFEAYFFPDSSNHLSLRAYNREGWLKGQPYRLDYRPLGQKGLPGSNATTSLNAKKDAKLDSIHLYALVIGTSNFRGSQLNLKYPDKDAAAFANAISLAGAPLFGENMEIKLLTTSAEPWPRKPEIAKALSDIAEKSSPNDILLVYLSGHGITYPPNSEKGRFYYLTTDILGDKLDDPTTLNLQAISQDTLQEWIRSVKALKRILILDACNSGRVVESLDAGEKALNSDQRRALERMNDRSGMFVLAGSAADKSSFEASRYGHGLLTYSLLNNMPLVAASNKSFIDISKLFNNALEEVPRLASDIGKVQKPELIGAESFDIGILDKKISFPIPQAIPVFIRSIFIDSQRNRDLSRLSLSVNTYLNELATQKEPSLAFWDIEEYQGEHFSIGGQYQVAGTSIKGNATLFRKDEELATFSFSGSTGQMKALAEQIIEKAFEIIEKTP